MVVSSTVGRGNAPNWSGALQTSALFQAAGPTASVTSTGKNGSPPFKFANFAIPTRVNRYALGGKGAPVPATLVLTDDGSGTFLFASNRDGNVLGDWADLQTIDLSSSTGYVVLTGQETVTVENTGGGLLTANKSALKTIIGGTGNSFYDLSSLTSGLSLQVAGGSSTGGNSEVAFSNAVIAGPDKVTLSNIQVLDNTGNTGKNSQGNPSDPSKDAIVNLSNFTGLTGLNSSYQLQTNGAADVPTNIVPSGYTVLQLLDGNGGAGSPSTNQLISGLLINYAANKFAVNLQGMANGTDSTRPNTGHAITIEIGLPILVAPDLKVWLSDTGMTFAAGDGPYNTGMNSSNFTIAGYETAEIYLTPDPAAGRGADFLGSEFFAFFPPTASGVQGKVTFYDNLVGGATTPPADLYLGRTDSIQSEPFALGDPTDSTGHDSVFVRGGHATLNSFGGGMLFVGATDASILNTVDPATGKSRSAGVVMDVAGTATGTAEHIAGIDVTGSARYQNLLQGTSGQIKLDTFGHAAADRVYTPLVQYGNLGNGLMGVGQDVLKGGEGAVPTGAAGTGGDNFFGAGGPDAIILSRTKVEPSTIWIGFYSVGHDAGTMGSADIGSVYGQAVTDATLDRTSGTYVEQYVNGYGFGYPDNEKFPGQFNTQVHNFSISEGDVVNFYAPSWATTKPVAEGGPNLAGLVSATGQPIDQSDVAPYAVVSTANQPVGSGNVVLDTIGTYSDAAELVKKLTTTDAMLFTWTPPPSQPFSYGSIAHILVAYGTAPIGGDVRIADVKIVNTSGVSQTLSSFDTAASSGQVTISATDLVVLRGAGPAASLAGNANIQFAVPRIAGTAGDDTFAAVGSSEVLHGGAGNDTASYLTSAASVTIGLTGSTGLGGDAEGDKLSNIENLLGSSFDDVLSGDAGNNTLVGGAGNDTVSYAQATAGVRVKLATVGRPQRTSGAGIDTLSGFENLTGSGFNDFLTGSAVTNVLHGGAGKDWLIGGGGVDTMDGGEDGDTYIIDSDIVHDTGTAGTDTVFTNRSTTLASDSGIEILSGKVGSTRSLALTGNELDNRIIGNDGNNLLRGLAGADSLYGGLGNDLLEGGVGRDTVSGGAGSDTYVFQAGDSKRRIFDIVLDFLSGVDKIDLDTIGAGGLLPGAYAETAIGSDDFRSGRDAAAAAMALGAISAAFVAGTTNGWLFWSTDGNNTTIEQAVRLNGANTLGAFDHADLI